MNFLNLYNMNILTQTAWAQTVRPIQALELTASKGCGNGYCRVDVINGHYKFLANYLQVEAGQTRSHPIQGNSPGNAYKIFVQCHTRG